METTEQIDTPEIKAALRHADAAPTLISRQADRTAAFLAGIQWERDRVAAERAAMIARFHEAVAAESKD